MIHIEPVPTPEEAAAIAAVIARFRQSAANDETKAQAETSRWASGVETAAEKRPSWGSWWRSK